MEIPDLVIGFIIGILATIIFFGIVARKKMKKG